MPDLNTLLSDLAYILITASIAVIACKRFNQPVVLGYIIAGFLASPHCHILPSISGTENIHIWAEIGVTFLLFALGLEFSVKQLKEVGKSAVITALTALTLFTVLGFVICYFMGWSRLDSAFLGCLLCMSSTTIVIKAFEDLKCRQEPFTDMVFGALIIEDLIGIILMVVMNAVATATDSNSTASAVLLAIRNLIFFITIWVICAVYFFPTLLRKIEPYINDEVSIILCIGLCFLMVIICDKLHFSSALGAFMTGSFLTATTDTRRLEELVRPLQYFFGAIFFISIGMLINPSALVRYALPITLCLLSLYFGKMVFNSLGFVLAGNSLKSSMQGGFSLTQIGEFALIACSVGVELKVLDGFLYPIIVAVSVISSITTPYFIRMAVPAHNFLQRHLPARLLLFLERFTDNDNSDEHDSVWFDFLSTTLTRTAIYSIICSFILLVIMYFASSYEPQTLSPFQFKLAVGAGALVCMSPFLYMLLSINDKDALLASTLWCRSKANRLPILLIDGVKMLIALGFISYVLDYIFELNDFVLFCASVLIAVAISRSQRALKSFINMEAQFVINLNAKELEARRSSPEPGHSSDGIGTLQDLDTEVHLAVYDLAEDSRLNEVDLRELALGEKMGVNIIQVERQGQCIEFPSADTMLKSGDRLTCIGSSLSFRVLDSVNKSYSLGLVLTEAPTSLKDYLESHRQFPREMESKLFYPVVLTIDKTSPVCNKSLRDVDMRNKWHCIAIGLERQGLAIRDLSPSLKLSEGDLLWLIGKQKMLSTLLQKGIL